MSLLRERETAINLPDFINIAYKFQTAEKKILFYLHELSLNIHQVVTEFNDLLYSISQMYFRINQNGTR